MKKLKLLFAAFALAMGVGSAWAQKDVTSQYITNATLSSLDGWTSVNFNTPVQGKNTVGYASEAYAGYGALEKTSYSLTQTITLPKGSYRLVNYSFFRQGDANDAEHNSKSLAYVVAGENKTLIKTLRSITAAGYANSQAEGANCFDSKMYRNVVEFEIDANNTEITIGIEGTFDEMRSWCIAGMFELFDLNDLASVSSPTDVTYAITNSGFEYRDLTGWTNNGLKYQNNNWANKSGIGFAEQWANAVALGSDKSMTQTLTNMPAGLYELSVYAHNIEQYNSDAAGTGMFLMANSDKIEITSYGLYKVRTTLTQDGDITIGINLDNCTGNWVAFDRFGLQFYGDPTAAYQELLDATVSEAQNLVNSGTLPTAAASNLQQVINDNDNDDHAFTEESQFNAAIAAIQAAENAVSALVAPYAAFNELKAKAQSLQAVANDNSSANEDLGNAISAATTNVAAAANVEAINTVTSTLKSAMITYVGAANPTGDAKFDITFMMTNPSLDAFAGWTENIDGWKTEQADGNSQSMVNDSKTNGNKDHFYEYWSNPAKANNLFTLYNAVTLPVGTYTMNCYAFAEDQYTETKNCAVYFYANDTQGSLVNTARLEQASISFNNTAEQEVKIGLKALEGNTYNWMGIGYIELYKVKANNTKYAINVNTTNATVTVKQGEETITESLPLETVTLEVAVEENYIINSVAASYNDGEKDVNLDVANPSAGVYTFQMPEYEVNVTVTGIVDKTALNAAIAAANDARKASNEGTGVFQIPAAAGTALATAIETAQLVYDNAEATVENVANAVTAINNAKATYEATELNAPEASTKYNIIIATEEHAKKDNAIIIVPGTVSTNNPTGYGLNANFAANSNLNQAVTFTKVNGNNYNISFETAEGTTYLTYGTTNGSAAEWSDSQIQATATAENKGEFTITPAANGTFNIINTITSTSVDCQAGGNIYTEGGNTAYTLAEATEASITINTTDAGWGTTMLPFAQALPEGVKAYTCAKVDGDQLTIVSVDALEANKPYIIEGTWEAKVSGWGLGKELTTTEGLLTGVYEATIVPVNSYVLQKNDNKVGFYQVAEGKQPTAAANRAYLTVSAESARAAFFFGDDTTTGIQAIEALTSGKAQIFNASGAQLPRLQKGMNIIRKADGKSYKVVVK